MDATARERIHRILEAHNRINEVQNQIDIRINQMTGGGDTDPDPPIDIHDAELNDFLDQIEAGCIRIEQRLHESLAKLNHINH